MSKRDKGMREADGYEAAFMEGKGDVLFRDKMVSRWPWHLAFLAPGAIAAGAALVAIIATGGPVGVAALAAGASMLGMAVPWMLFAVLRITVSTGAVHVQFGLSGPEIPIDAIIEAEAIEYDWKEFGGFGIRFAPNKTTVYNMIGDEGLAVRIRWRDGDVVRTTIVASHDNEGLAAAIAEARSSRSSESRVVFEEEQKVTRVRVEELAEMAEVEVAAEDEAEDERETEAD